MHHPMIILPAFPTLNPQITTHMSPSQQEGGRKKHGDSVRLVTDILVAMALTAGQAVILRILDLIHEALCDNSIVSKRCADPPSQILQP